MSFIYYHVPKTGGVSFRKLLEDSFRVNKILHITSPSKGETEEYLRQYKFIHGHFFEGDLPVLNNYRKLISIREPISRCISTYNFLREQNLESSLWREIDKKRIYIAKNSSLLEFFNSRIEEIYFHSNNMQTRILCGIRDSGVQLTNAHFEIAYKKINEFDFVALNCEFELSQLLFALKFGFICPSEQARMNKYFFCAALTSSITSKFTV